MQRFGNKDLKGKYSLKQNLCLDSAKCWSSPSPFATPRRLRRCSRHSSDSDAACSSASPRSLMVVKYHLCRRRQQSLNFVVAALQSVVIYVAEKEPSAPPLCAYRVAELSRCCRSFVPNLEYRRYVHLKVTQSAYTLVTV
eukprot:6180968-Pleurochrysis_carterae.AAC.2